jgi:amino-acid N-acetyltransferase
MDIKTLDRSDLEQVKGILKKASLPFADLAAAQMDHFLGVCSGTDDLVGVIGLECYGRAGLLRSLAVRKDFRNQGIGTNLMHHVQVLATRLDLKALYLLTTTAEGYFRRHGFTPFDRHKVPAPVEKSAEFRYLCPDSAVCMRKVLIGHGLG